MRLNRFLAACGVASRRKCDEIIKAGRVLVNGKSGDLTGLTIDPGIDIVEYEGKRLKLAETKRYILLNKPSGYMTTCSDDKGRDTVLSLIEGFQERLFPVGRLDFDTEGLLILTNDGELTYCLTHPKHEIEKTYFARVSGRFTPEIKEHIENGILLEGRPTSKSKVELLKFELKCTDIHITIHEGRNRQVRRMLEAVGLTVLYLKRIKIGNLNLNGLNSGEYRELTEQEVRYLYSLSK